uniref:Cupin n=1 Tax=uncultured bacterium pAM1 TaxID=1781153 RepID=A0A1C9U4X7_9BACT|nr:cupin [uncultured bacterium pAM1]
MKNHEFQSAEVISINASIEYASNAVVSKMVLKKPNGHVTLFAFDSGEELSEHTSPFDALVQVIDGTAEILIFGQSFTVTTGESIILPGNVPHAVKANERFKMLLTMVK